MEEKNLRREQLIKKCGQFIDQELSSNQVKQVVIGKGKIIYRSLKVDRALGCAGFWSEDKLTSLRYIDIEPGRVGVLVSGRLLADGVFFEIEDIDKRIEGRFDYELHASFADEPYPGSKVMYVLAKMGWFKKYSGFMGIVDPYIDALSFRQKLFLFSNDSVDAGGCITNFHFA